MIGDIVGDPGLEALEKKLPGIIRERQADITVVNGENAAEGFGLTEPVLARILAAGADVVTGGNHIWEKRDFWPVLDRESRILRPANYPAGSPGRGFTVIRKPAPAGLPGDISWVVINLQGREFMQSIDCPFRCFDGIEKLLEIEAPERKIILVDFHAESQEEKEALAFYLDGRASLVAGTHTHVQTADARILPKGTACISDLGMTGIRESVIGMDPKVCLDRVRFQVLYRMQCAKPGPETGEPSLEGVFAEIDGNTGRALMVEAINSHHVQCT